MRPPSFIDRVIFVCFPFTVSIIGIGMMLPLATEYNTGYINLDEFVGNLIII